MHQLQSIPWLSFPKKKALRKVIQSQLDNESTNISEVSILWKNPWQVLGSFHYEDISQSSIQESIERRNMLRSLKTQRFYTYQIEAVIILMYPSTVSILWKQGICARCCRICAKHRQKNPTLPITLICNISTEAHKGLLSVVGTLCLPNA